MNKKMIKFLSSLIGLCYIPFAQGVESGNESLRTERSGKTNLPFTLLDLQTINGMSKKWQEKIPEKFSYKKPSKLSDFCEFLFEKYPEDETFLINILGEEYIDKWKKNSITQFKPTSLLDYLFKDISNILKEKLFQKAGAFTYPNNLPGAFVQSMANFSKEEDQSTLIQRAIDLTQADLERPGNRIILGALKELQKIIFGNIFSAPFLFFFLNQEIGEKIKEEKQKAELEHAAMCAAVEEARLARINQARILFPPEESKEECSPNPPVRTTSKNDRQDQKVSEEPKNKNSRWGQIPITGESVVFVPDRNPEENKKIKYEDDFEIIE